MIKTLQLCLGTEPAVITMLIVKVLVIWMGMISNHKEDGVIFLLINLENLIMPENVIFVCV